ncbi:MAG: DNA repair exonuclease [Blautia sp.]|nr:DNA repair exonuclease [Blautia sp.]
MKFIHLADVHLGAVPDRGCPWSARREEEIWETFRRVIAVIRSDPVDFLFIAGDLFHRQPLLRELKEVNYLFSTIPDTKVFLIAGNHDYMGKDSFYHTFSWEKNVTFFQKETLTCVDAGKGVYVYGLSYHHRELKEPLYDNARPGKEEGCHILLAHGGDEDHIPIRYSALHTAGFDYIALGHIHKPQILFPGQMAYAGALEPVDRGDLGTHGYLAGSWENGRLRLEFVPFACRSYQQITLTVREDSTQYSLEDMLQADIRSRGSQNLYQVTLEGIRSPELLLIPEKLQKLGNITEVVDESRPAYDLEALEKQYSGTLIGDYITHFRKMGQLSETEKKALYYGLQALLETGRGRG